MGSTTSTTTNSTNSSSVLGEGPYVWSVVHDHVESTRPCGGHAIDGNSNTPTKTRPVKLPLTVTVPMASSSGSSAPPGPFPVCVLLNGFQVCRSLVHIG